MTTDPNHNFGWWWNTADESGNIGPDIYDVSLLRSNPLDDPYTTTGYEGTDFEVRVRGIRVGAATLRDNGKWTARLLVSDRGTDVWYDAETPKGLARCIASCYGLHLGAEDSNDEDD